MINVFIHSKYIQDFFQKTAIATNLVGEDIDLDKNVSCRVYE